MGITSQASTTSPSETIAPARVPGTDKLPNVPVVEGRCLSVRRGIFGIISFIENYCTRWMASVSQTGSQAPQSVQSSPTLNDPLSFFSIAMVGQASRQSPSFLHFS
jgi:hypothetical protein